MDYNPSEQYHWIYDQVLTRKDVHYIQSTYKANPFLEREKVKEIEGYMEADENYYRIYGLGERGVGKTVIFSHWRLCDELPEGGEIIYGLDFGYNNELALSKNVIKDNEVYSKELIYKTHLKGNEMVEEVKAAIDDPNAPIYCDPEDPQGIADLVAAGLYAIPAKKGKGSVLAGIREVQKRKWHITKDSSNMQKEARSYRWKEKNGEALDEPVKKRDHLMDSVRMPIFSHLGDTSGIITADDYFFA